MRRIEHLDESEQEVLYLQGWGQRYVDNKLQKKKPFDPEIDNGLFFTWDPIK